MTGKQTQYHGGEVDIREATSREFQDQALNRSSQKFALEWMTSFADGQPRPFQATQGEMPPLVSPYPPGTVFYPNGLGYEPDGTVLIPANGRGSPYLTEPPGTVILPDGSVHAPNGTVFIPPSFDPNGPWAIEWPKGTRISVPGEDAPGWYY